MSEIVEIRTTRFGEGIPKLCIPLTDTNFEELKCSADTLKNVPFDIVEWRADFYKDIKDSRILSRTLVWLREQLKEQPLLFTIRTVAEGGMLDISTEEYIKLLTAVIDSRQADLIDVEFSRGGSAVASVCAAARRVGVKTLVSLHDFTATPSKDRMVQLLSRMQQSGADMVKLAVMPQCAKDVLALLEATLEVHEEHKETPIVTMSMGRQGAVSRVCGSVFGSCMTFGTAGKASAPGQLPAVLLSSLMNRM